MRAITLAGSISGAGGAASDTGISPGEEVAGLGEPCEYLGEIEIEDLRNLGVRKARHGGQEKHFAEVEGQGVQTNDVFRQEREGRSSVAFRHRHWSTVAQPVQTDESGEAPDCKRQALFRKVGSRRQDDRFLNEIVGPTGRVPSYERPGKPPEMRGELTDVVRETRHADLIRARQDVNAW